MTADRVFGRWLRANAVGWLLGFVFLFVGGIAADLLGVEAAQFYLGIGMGAGIGYAQARVAVPLLGVTAWWGWACVVGLGTPFVVSDLVRAVWGGLEYRLALHLNVTAGGLLIGLLQRPMLRGYGGRSAWWVAACAAGWTLAAATVEFYGQVPGMSSGAGTALLNLVALLLGGVVLGAVTGGSLVWMRRR